MNKITFEDLPNTNTPIDASNLNTLQSNVETAINSGDSGTVTEVENWVKDKTGLGATTKILDSANINSIDNSTFAYLLSCNYGGTSIDNGYLVNVVYTANYKVQIYFKATGGGIKYRRCVNGTWTDWLEEYSYSLDLQSYYINSWTTNGISTAFVDGDYKTLQISCQNGTNANILTLPPALRPSGSVLLPAVNIASNTAGYMLITTNGNVSTNLTVGSGQKIVCSGGYY